MAQPPAAVTNATAELAHAWYAVALSSEVTDEPIQVWLLGRPWAVLRLQGRVVAFADRCPHRLAPLSLGANCGDSLQCRYHGWRFGPDGRCVEVPSNGPDVPIPAKAAATVPAGVIERYGLVWLAPSEPVCDLHDFREWDDPSFDRAWTAPRRTSAGAGQLTDNFLDASHFPTVHASTFGVAESAYVAPHDVVRDGWEVRTVYDTWYANRDDPLVETGAHPLVQPQELHKIGRPFSCVLLRLKFPLTGATITILFSCTPETATTSRIYKMMARDDTGGDGERLKAFVADEERILDEDLAVLERYPHTELHLDLREELHVRADRLSVAYRRLLADFVAG
jgi:phenylpropionate dioxygenase-like ring-hydroxylating dioxygenase large terminal subunit